jgi:serine/threonine protein phosphatase PrpC
LLKDPKFAIGEYDKALKASFLKIDALLSTEAGKQEVIKIGEEIEESEAESPSKKGMVARVGEGPEMKGCTANVVLIKKNNLYIANAGDSRAVLAKGKKATDLSTDHKPDNPEETKRINKAGGSVIEGRVDGNLNLSRALGDLHYKGNKSLTPEQQMICADPELRTVPITKDFDFIVMGCDGVYESKSSQEIVEFFYKEMASNGGKISPAIEKFLDENCSPDVMKTEGIGCDNMTCILIKFQHS